MDNIYFKEATNRTPHIRFDAITGSFELSGRSILDNAEKFFSELVNLWPGQYVENPRPSTILLVNLEYFNTATSMWIVRLLKKLELLHQRGQSVLVRWLYSDEDMLESGEDFRELVDLPFEFSPDESPEL